MISVTHFALPGNNGMSLDAPDCGGSEG